ncbi:ABC transporter ATP-binding protein [Stutzerimonas azotifigens]|uniref:ABC transporter ATP-binding protein n=1 Tax=Stutzerimonas azotifigens TaxID=291995 RepID=A0ABR5Z5M4_9GAMM|nr:ABC transporter ATP-binding protein [Stutzerimonas azotifigens]MBA1275431.1 ABC transporter ATP-binding protein [Stutzerimonas azotifigens]
MAISELQAYRTSPASVTSRTTSAPVEIEFRGVAKSFPKKGSPDAMPVVQEVNFSIRRGEVVSIIGPSGCGKSTMLNMGSGLYMPSAGDVFISGEKVSGPVRKVAFMLQKDLLMPWRTIRRNIELGLEIEGVPSARRAEVANALLVKCHLEGFGDHYPFQLSGGMRQRAALARTLAIDPQVLFLDEPFSALDAQTKMILQQDLALMLHEQQKTALFITHDLVEAIAMSDRILVMSARPGTLIEEIKVNLPLRENPLERRKLPEIGPLAGRLMELLKVGESTDLH